MRWDGVRVFGDLRQGCFYERAVIVSIHLPRVSFWRSAITAFGLFDFFYHRRISDELDRQVGIEMGHWIRCEELRVKLKRGWGRRVPSPRKGVGEWYLDLRNKIRLLKN